MRGCFGIVALISLIATISLWWMPEDLDKSGWSFRAFWSRLKQVLSMFLNKPFMKMALLKLVYNFRIGLGAVMTYWYVDVAKWSKGFIGIMGSFAYVFAAIFVIVFASSLKHVRFRVILIWLQIGSAIMSALDLILVCVAKDAFWGHFFALGDR